MFDDAEVIHRYTRADALRVAAWSGAPSSHPHRRRCATGISWLAATSEKSVWTRHRRLRALTRTRTQPAVDRGQGF